MSLKAVFQALRKQTRISVREYARELNYPSGFEPGLKNLQSNATVLCRDDGIVEMMSGPGASVTVDGPAQTVGVQGGAVVLQGNTVQLQAPPGGLWLGYQRFNPAWFSPPIDPLFRWRWQNAPLVQRFPGALGQGPDGFIPGPPPAPFVTATFLTGVPGPGQSLVSLAEYLEAKPLFGPNEELKIMAEHIGQLLKSTLVPGGD